MADKALADIYRDIALLEYHLDAYQKTGDQQYYAAARALSKQIRRSIKHLRLHLSRQDFERMLFRAPPPKDPPG